MVESIEVEIEISLENLKILALEEIKEFLYTNHTNNTFFSCPNLLQLLYDFINEFVQTQKYFTLSTFFFKFINVFMCDNDESKIKCFEPDKVKNKLKYHATRYKVI